MVRSLPPINSGQFGLGLLAYLMQGTEAPLILEIGANDGTHTAQFLGQFPNAQVYAFEPDPRAIAKFKARGPHPRLQLFEMAIGDEDGEAQFHVSSGMRDDWPPEVKIRYPQGWDQSGSLRPPKTHKTVHPWVKFDSTIAVSVRRLDSWAREHAIGRVDFIWADVQGAEGDLIAGGPETLARTRYLYTEYSDEERYDGQPSLSQLLDMLPDFSVLRRYQTDVLLENTATN
jgi:FkbM family methyltransferase